MAALPAPRVSMDIDLVLLIEDETQKLSVLDRYWTAGRRAHEYRWQRKPEVTLDLVSIRTGKSTSMGQAHVGREGGTRRLTPVQVLRSWILSSPIVEDCFEDQLRTIHLRRLNHLGLLASKLSAIPNRLKAMKATADRAAAGQPLSAPVEAERLPKDVSDAVLLLDRACRDRISFLPGQMTKELIPHLRKLVEKLVDQMPAPPTSVGMSAKNIHDLLQVVR